MAKEKAKIYGNFFTNCAVAWFTAGVIAPAFTQPKSFSTILPSAIAIILAFIFLRFATSFANTKLR